jgi:hypothetical protein
MLERQKLPQSRLYLRAAQWGINRLAEDRLLGSGFHLHLIGVLASLRAVQHALRDHDSTLSPTHRAAIDEWWQRTSPRDNADLAFIVDSRNRILKAGSFAAYAIASESRTGDDDAFEVTSRDYELVYYSGDERRDLLAAMKDAAAWCDRELAAIEAHLPDLS